jgi:hypothetical protein
VPVAVNCWLRPSATPGLAGLTAIDITVAVVTVTVTGAEVTPFKAALMTLEPVFTPVACPCEPVVLLMEATAGEAELQVTELVMIWVV